MTVPIAEVFTGPIIKSAIFENISFVLKIIKLVKASQCLFLETHLIGSQ